MSRRHYVMLTALGILSLARFSAQGAETVTESAANGAKVYARPGLCGTCHQANGAGIPGAFPPLAGSEWVTGGVPALIRMVVHGIEGEITVSGTTYNAVMPAQGGQLSDQEIADVLTYIRSSWGNTAGQVTTKEVTAQKRLDKDRGEKPWTAGELKTVLEGMALAEPKVQIIPGSWREIPEITALTAPTKTIDGTLNPRQAPKGGGLLIATGTLTSTKAGEAAITLKANGPAQAWIDDELVVQTPVLIASGERPRIERIGVKQLAAGVHQIRIVSLATAESELKVSAAINLPGFAKPIALTDSAAEAIERGESGLDRAPSVRQETMIYRGVFAQTSARSIAVGYPERLALMFDAVNATWSMAWRGDFVTGRHHWSGRGMGFREWPLGDQIAFLPAEPPFAVLAKPEAEWPGKCDIDRWPKDYQFLGYDLDKAQRPTFRYRVGTATITDTPEPQADGRTLRRTLKITADQAIPGLTFRAIAGQDLAVINPLSYRLDKRLTITLTLPSGTTPVVRRFTGGQEVLVPVTFAGTAATIGQEYHWEDVQ